MSEKEHKIEFEIDGKLFIKITKEGIHFYRNSFHYEPGKFATEFMDIIEKSFDVKFEKRVSKKVLEDKDIASCG